MTTLTSEERQDLNYKNYFKQKNAFLPSLVPKAGAGATNNSGYSESKTDGKINSAHTLIQLAISLEVEEENRQEIVAVGKIGLLMGKTTQVKDTQQMIYLQKSQQIQVNSLIQACLEKPREKTPQMRMCCQPDSHLPRSTSDSIQIMAQSRLTKQCLYCELDINDQMHKRHETSHVVSYSCTECNSDDRIYHSIRAARRHERLNRGHTTHVCVHTPRPLTIRGTTIPLAPRWRRDREFRVRLSPEPRTPTEGDESDSDSDNLYRGSLHTDSSTNTSTKEESDDNTNAPSTADVMREADDMMADVDLLLNDFDLDFVGQDPANEGGIQLAFERPIEAELQMEAEPYGQGYQAMNNHLPVIPPPHHQVPPAEPPEGYHHARHQGEPVYAVERVYGERVPGQINGLLEYEPAPELPMFAVFAPEDLEDDQDQEQHQLPYDPELIRRLEELD